MSGRRLPQSTHLEYFQYLLDSQFLDALASLESMMSVIVSITENNWVTDKQAQKLVQVDALETTCNTV